MRFEPAAVRPLYKNLSRGHPRAMGFLSRLGMMIRGVPAKPMVRQGVGGTNAVGGFLVSNERSPDLSFGPQRFKTLNEMALNCTVVGTGVRYFLSMVAGVGWTVEPPKNKGSEAERLAELVDDIIHDMEVPWYRVARGAALFKLMGFSVQERIAKRRDDGVIGYESIERRPQWTIEQWDLDECSIVHGWGQRVPYSGELLYIPREKCVYLVDDSISDQPDGVGLLRHVVEAHRQLKRFEQLEGWGYETDARGIPVGRVPLGLLDSLVDAGLMTRPEADRRIRGIKEIVKNHVKNPGLGIYIDSAVYTDKSPNQTPSGTPLYGLELLRGDGAGLAEINEAIKRKNFEIARVLGIEGLLLGGDGKGSLALATDKTSAFAQLLSSTMDELAWQFRRDVIAPLFEMNGWDKRLMPKLKPDAVRLSNVKDVIECVERLAGAGAPLPPTDRIWNQLREMLGVVEGDEILAPLMGSILGGSPALPPPRPAGPTPAPRDVMDEHDEEDEVDVEDEQDVEDEKDIAEGEDMRTRARSMFGMNPDGSDMTSDQLAERRGRAARDAVRAARRDGSRKAARRSAPVKKRRRR